jgi:hypothetical protein
LRQRSLSVRFVRTVQKKTFKDGEMKIVKTLFKIGLLLIALLVVIGIYLDRNRDQRILCEMTYYDYDSQINAAIRSEGFDKVAHLQAAQILLQILHHRGCCEYKTTCPGGLKL